jgi:hypothetical protein
MAPPKKNETPVSSNTDESADELPIVESLGIVYKRGLGWVVVALRTQGMRVLSVEQCGEPETQMVWGLERLKIEVSRRLLTVRSKVKA